MARSSWSLSPTVTVVTRALLSLFIRWIEITSSLCSMSDPGTTYRTRDEVQRMRQTHDPIRGLARYIEEWGLATEEDIKVS